MHREVEIIIHPGGKVTFNLDGWNGKGCHDAVEDLLEAVGKVVKRTKKGDFYKSQFKQKIEGRERSV
jgi:hypothetical protein